MHMKKCCLLAVLVSAAGVYADNSVAGAIGIETGLGSGHMQNTNQILYANYLSYTSGGVTFTYPSGFFTATPFVRVTVSLLNRSYHSYEVAIPEIVSTSSTQATVRVNIGSGVTYPPIFEANTNDVTVYLEAWQIEETLP